MSIPIYQQHAGNPVYYHYSPRNDDPVWKNDHVAFQAFREQKGKAVPIYQMWHPGSPTRYIYSFCSNQPGWTLDGSFFYAYKEQIPGTVPVYDYQDEDEKNFPDRHMYSVSETAGEGWKQIGPAFYALPPDIKYKWDNFNIKYDENKKPPTSPDFLHSKKINNNSGAEYEESIEVEKKKSSTFEWGLSQSLQVGVAQTFDVDIPFCGGSETTLSITLGLEAHQTFSETIEETYSIDQTIKVPPRTAVKVDSYIDWVDDFKTKFTLSADFSALGPDGKPLSADQLEELLQSDGFSGKIESKGENKLRVSVRGEFTGSYGVDTYIDIEEIPINKK